MRNLVEGATVNDVALAVIGGALRTTSKMPARIYTHRVRCAVDDVVSVRTESEKAHLATRIGDGNRRLATDVADPVGTGLAAV